MRFSSLSVPSRQMNWLLVLFHRPAVPDWPHRFILAGRWSVGLIVALVLGGFSRTRSMQGRMRDCAITIDGRVGEWTSEFTSFEDDAISVVVRNDESSLYVTAAISDPELALQAMACGLVLWLDPDD